MRWCVCTMGFEELDALKRLIPSLIKSGVKNILYFDGPFEHFPTDHESSQDGSLEYLKKFEEVEIFKCGTLSHIDKSTIRFKKAAELKYDAVVFIDCDEFMIGNFEQFTNFAQSIRSRHTNMDAMNLCLFDLDGVYKDRSVAQRIFFGPRYFFYQDLHWVIVDKRTNQRILATHTVGGLQIFHDSTIRPKEREEKMIEFQEIYTPLETEAYRAKNPQPRQTNIRGNKINMC